MQSPQLSSHLYQKTPFSCPDMENFIWIEPLLRRHLSSKTTFSLSQMWPLNTGLSVLRANKCYQPGPVGYPTLMDMWTCLNGDTPTSGWWFSPGTPVSSTNVTDLHNITEILLRVVFYTQNCNPWLNWKTYSVSYYISSQEIDHLSDLSPKINSKELDSR